MSLQHFQRQLQKGPEADIKNLDFADNFTISESAVKKQARALKSVIKLDKNFDIYVHGNRNLIEQGRDEKGTYYKIYYQKEN